MFKLAVNCCKSFHFVLYCFVLFRNIVWRGKFVKCKKVIKIHRKSITMLTNILIKSKTFSLSDTMVGMNYGRYVTSNLQL